MKIKLLKEQNNLDVMADEIRYEIEKMIKLIVSVRYHITYVEFYITPEFERIEELAKLLKEKLKIADSVKVDGEIIKVGVSLY